MTQALDTAAILERMKELEGFTAEPWELHKFSCFIEIRGDDDGFVCQIQTAEGSNDIDDAALIAAAPDMRATILALCDALDAERAENARLRRALTDIAEGIPTPDRAEAYRTDGKPSKLDKCHHGLAMYEDCGECVSDFARAALAQKGGQ